MHGGSYQKQQASLGREANSERASKNVKSMCLCKVDLLLLAVVVKSSFILCMLYFVPTPPPIKKERELGGRDLNTA